MSSTMLSVKGVAWSNSSVLALMKQKLAGEAPADIIRRKAHALTQKALSLGWEGPPFNPEVLASVLGIEVVASKDPLGSEARIFPTSDGTVRIEYDESYPRTRINFSICHEIIHTFFPDCYETVRNRKHASSVHERKHKELESLCDLGAAELLLPEVAFSRDLETRGPSLDTIVQLAELYGASTEATMIRVVRFGKGSFGTAVFSEKLKPTEKRTSKTASFGFMGTDLKPKLRVDYSSTTAHFDVFIPKDKSAPTDSVAYRALVQPGVHSGCEEWDIAGFGIRRVQAVALPKVNEVNRVGMFFFRV